MKSAFLQISICHKANPLTYVFLAGNVYFQGYVLFEKMGLDFFVKISDDLLLVVCVTGDLCFWGGQGECYIWQLIESWQLNFKKTS